MPRIIPLFLLCAAANAAEVAQFRAEDFGPEWPAARGRATLSAVHAPANGWAAAFADGGGVSFDATNGVASPLAFDSAVTVPVSRVMIVACCAGAESWASLLDAPTGAALAPRTFARESASFAAGNCLGAVAVSVDGTPGAAMPTDSTPHLVEISFPEPVSAADLYLGGHPASPSWNRSWRGKVHEALFCFGETAAAEDEAIRAYLSLRWRLGLDFDTPPDIAGRLRALGVDPGTAYDTVLILR
ncbi:MAG: hypothetical protein IJ783_04105 [Kiritimatiellae bacterium]|nr:hypothetical protein [Kiritimatiellia bacterium]